MRSYHDGFDLELHQRAPVAEIFMLAMALVTPLMFLALPVQDAAVVDPTPSLIAK